MSVGAAKDGRAKTEILLVEDDPDDVFFIEQALGGLKDQVRLSVVEDGAQAQDYLAGHPPFADRVAYPLPEVVLLDIKLPKKTGLEVLDWMKGVDGLAHVLVVMMSSSTDRHDVEQAYDLGANAYVPKEAESSTLEMIMRGILAFVDAVRAERTGLPHPRATLAPPEPPGQEA